MNRLTIMERGLLNEDGTAVVTLLNHAVLNSNQQWADLDRRGNWPLTLRKRRAFAAAPRHRGLAALRVKGWLDYRWARTVDGESSNYRQTRGVTPTNEYWAVRLPDLDPALVALMQYDAAGNLTLDRLAVNAGDPCGPGVPACGSGQPCGVGILSGVDPGSAGLSACPTGQEYVYDVEHRLTEVKRHSDGATLARYEYDALGRRIHTIEYVDAATGDTLNPPRKTRHVYVGIETIQEYECTVQPPCEAEDWNLAREFLWALDAWTTALQSSASAEAGPLGLMRQGWGDPARFPEPVAMITHGGEGGGQGGTGVPAGESAYHYLHDVLGSVVGLTDSAGALVERYTYDPYGKPLIEKRDLSTNDWQLTTASSFGNPWLWIGQRYDAGVGLYAFLFRTYSPALGRWLQRDPIGYAAGSINLYDYALGRPLRFTDPFGAFPVQDELIRAIELIGLVDPNINTWNDPHVADIGFATLAGGQYGKTEFGLAADWSAFRFVLVGDQYYVQGINLPSLPDKITDLGKYLNDHLILISWADVLTHEFWHKNNESWGDFYYGKRRYGADATQGAFLQELRFLLKLIDLIDCKAYPLVCAEIRNKIHEAQGGGQISDAQACEAAYGAPPSGQEWAISRYGKCYLRPVPPPPTPPATSCGAGDA